MDLEIEALIKFIEAREPGNVLREIAKTRLEKALRTADIMVDPKPKKVCNKPNQYQDAMSGEIFPTLSDAAHARGVKVKTLQSDVYKGAHKYGLFRLP